MAAVSEETFLKRTAKNVFSGTMAGIAVCLVGHPFDTLKVSPGLDILVWVFYKLFDEGESGSSQISQNLLISGDVKQSQIWKGFEECGLNPMNPESNNVLSYV